MKVQCPGCGVWYQEQPDSVCSRCGYRFDLGIETHPGVVIHRRDGKLFQVCQLCSQERVVRSRKRPALPVCWKCRSGRNPHTIKAWMLWNMEVRWISKELDTPCWLWTGHKWNTGYGEMRVEGKYRAVHRVSASLWLGFDMDSKLHVCHECDQRACFNPEHLFIGTHKDNITDASKKGKMARGSRHWKAKLNENQVLEIRRRLVKGEMVGAVAREFGVTPGHIYSIRDGVLGSGLKQRGKPPNKSEGIWRDN